jgi:endo-1,4-beta-xylanase
VTLETALPLSRRNALAGLAALPLLGCARVGLAATGPGPAAASFPPVAGSLDSLARRSARRWGSAINWNVGDCRAHRSRTRATPTSSAPNAAWWCRKTSSSGRRSGPRPSATISPGWTRSPPGLKTNDQALRGHTLLWHRPQWFPEWLNTYDYGANPVREAERLLTDHIRTVTDRYRGQITSYDVVNEAIDHDTNAAIETSMSRAMGSPEAVLDLAFHTAREQLPEGELVYNDYMSWEPAHAAHCDDVLRLLEGFRKRGVPVDALGIQAHIEIFSLDPATGVGPYREREWRSFLDEVVAMGYRLLITEFDVKEKALPTGIAARDAKVADYTRRYFDLMLDYDELGDILAWGMVDEFNWLQGFAPRDDGLEVRGTPYASDYSAKPMRQAIAAAFAAASA